ncbi:MAG: hypothetical protein A2846_03560 [Candidatus Doudnabacteria bacterium RIFCSPHIGHO2_01_FULL_49_9]|nr:MAG: hypothetical protein A2846_03560 [Candidatus Doudnabacteria bacterium RIFCSPHIGHO2_01_FULL_49_9]
MQTLVADADHELGRTIAQFWAGVEIAEFEADIKAASLELQRRIAAGEVDPADLPQPGEGPNHFLIRRAHELTCSCATDPASCYPHTHGKKALFRER